MDRPRSPGRVGRLRAALVGADGDLLRAVAAVDSTLLAQIPGLAQPLWQSQRAPSPGAARPLAGAVGEGSDREVLCRVSPGRLSAVVFHDAGRGHCGGQSSQRLPGAQRRRAPGQSMEQAFAQRHGVCAAIGSARSLAHRFFLRERGRNVLLPVQHSGRVFALHRPLGKFGKR